MTKIKLPRAVKRLFPLVDFAVDAKRPIEISVNAKDCKEAVSKNPSDCALARATKREKHADGVIIGMSSSYVIKGNKATRYQTPDSVQREIMSFDRHHDFQPGDYYLTPKSPSATLGVSHRTPRKGSNNPNKTVKRKIHRSARVRILPRGAE